MPGFPIKATEKLCLQMLQGFRVRAYLLSDSVLLLLLQIKVQFFVCILLHLLTHLRTTDELYSLMFIVYLKILSPTISSDDLIGFNRIHTHTDGKKAMGFLKQTKELSCHDFIVEIFRFVSFKIASVRKAANTKKHCYQITMTNTVIVFM